MTGSNWLRVGLRSSAKVILFLCLCVLVYLQKRLLQRSHEFLVAPTELTNPPQIFLDSSSSSSSLSLSAASSDSLPPRLELVHIPKNGGTSLEYWAALSNITWGACHFDFRWKYNSRNLLRNCPESIRITKILESNETFWHYPLWMIRSENISEKFYGGIDPYDNLLDAELVSRPKRFFAVVRDPYERLISLYYMNRGIARHGPNSFLCKNNKKVMNRYLSEQIVNMQNVSELYCHHGCAFVPQHHYIADPNTGRRDVHHILHTESLYEEFRALQFLYGLNFTNFTKVNANEQRCDVRLKVHDLWPEVIDLINRVYAKDFELGNYTMLKNGEVGRAKRFSRRRNKVREIDREKTYRSTMLKNGEWVGRATRFLRSRNKVRVTGN